MAKRMIRRYPDPLLRRPAKPIKVIDDEVRRLAADMIETMLEAKGVGLAAPQVGEGVRLAVVDFDPENSEPRILVNPVVVRRSSRKETADEGCLSFPGMRGKVKRAFKVTCQAQNLDGELVEYQAEGLPARAIQHELDHLDGMLFIDKAGPSDKLSFREELAELEFAYENTRSGAARE